MTTGTATSPANDDPTWMYHEFDAPEGRIFRTDEVPKLRRAGWADTPAKFGQGFRSLARRQAASIVAFLQSEWKWAIGALVAIIALFT